MARNVYADGIKTYNGSIQAEMFLPFCKVGLAAAGALTATGTQVGDQVICALNITGAADVSSSFEKVVTVANQIQQLNSNFSAATLVILVAPQS